jgi:flagellar motor switch protein FliM
MFKVIDQMATREITIDDIFALSGGDVIHIEKF